MANLKGINGHVRSVLWMKIKTYSFGVLFLLFFYYYHFPLLLFIFILSLSFPISHPPTDPRGRSWVAMCLSCLKALKRHVTNSGASIPKSRGISHSLSLSLSFLSPQLQIRGPYSNAARTHNIHPLPPGTPPLGQICFRPNVNENVQSNQLRHVIIQSAFRSGLLFLLIYSSLNTIIVKLSRALSGQLVAVNRQQSAH